MQVFCINAKVWNESHIVWESFQTSIFLIQIAIHGNFSKTHRNPTGNDENHKAFKDPLHVLVGPITKARSKKIKEALNGLIQEIWADFNAGHSKLGPKEDEGVINLIQAIEG